MSFECKADVKKHESEKLDQPRNYCVDGALYYAKFLKNEFNVIALAVSGTDFGNCKVSAFYWIKTKKQYITLDAARDNFYPPEIYLKIIKVNR